MCAGLAVRGPLRLGSLLVPAEHHAQEDLEYGTAELEVSRQRESERDGQPGATADAVSSQSPLSATYAVGATQDMPSRIAPEGETVTVLRVFTSGRNWEASI